MCTRSSNRLMFFATQAFSVAQGTAFHPWSAFTASMMDSMINLPAEFITAIDRVFVNVQPNIFCTPHCRSPFFLRPTLKTYIKRGALL